MGFDGNGNWSSPFYPVQDRDNGIAILASKFQTLIQTNLKESFENCITRDGAGKPTTNINWNGNKITNLQNGTSSADAVNKSQLDAVDTAKVAKSGDTMTGDLTISKSDASLKLINDNSVEYDITANDNGNLELVPAAGSGKKVYLNASDDYKPYYNDGTYDYKFIDNAGASHYAMPDFTSGVSYTKGTKITVPSDGLFIFHQDSGNYATASVTIYDTDGTTQLASWTYRNYNDDNTAIVPIPKGLQVQFDASYNYTLYFYPFFTN